MPRALTSPELALLRSDTQFTKLYLAAIPPNVIYTAQLSAVPSSNDGVYQISFGSGSGTLSDVKIGMALRVGTSALADDLGRGAGRIRKTPIAGTFYIGITSEIAWDTAGTIYLTVVDDFDLHPKHPTVTAGVLSMDTDVAYSDQHADFNPVPIMGTHACVWLDDATVDVDFDASDSWVFGSTISTYAWTAPGSSASSGMATATPTITYNAAGRYCVYCTVTSADGKSTTGVRHVFVFDRGDNMPYTVFQLAQCVGDYDSGGWMFDMTMEAEASLSEIVDRSLVVLFAEDWYGTTQQSIGPLLNRENIVCVGRIAGESIRWDSEGGLVHFTVQGLQHWLNQIKALPVELSFAGAATKWEELPALTVDRALWHILYWHSTAIETMDFYPSNDTRYTVEARSIASKIWGQLQDIAVSKLLASPGVSRFGQLFAEIDPQMVPEVDRDWATVMDITADDFDGALDFGRQVVHDTGLITLTAEEVNANGFSATRYSLSPGHFPKRHGEVMPLDRILCSSQSNANQLAGLALGWHLNEFPDLPVTFAMNNRMLDIFPRQFCSTTIDAANTPRGIAETLNLIPRHIGFYFDGDTGFMHPEVNFEGETFEQIAVDGDVPEATGVDFSVPTLPSFPSLPNLPVLLPGLDGFTNPTVSGPPKVLVHSPNVGLLYSKNFNTDDVTWVTLNAGLTTTQAQKINRVVICPNGAMYAGFIGDETDAFLARAPYVGATFVIIEDETSINSKLGGAGMVLTFNCNPLVSEQVAYVLYSPAVNDVEYEIYLGAGASFANTMTLTGVYGDGGSISYGNGLWVLTCQYYSAGGHCQWVTLNAGLTAKIDNDNVPSLSNIVQERHRRVGTSAKIYMPGDWLADTITITEDNFASATDGIGADYSGQVSTDDSSFEVDPSGNYFMCDRVTTRHGKSSDGGYTLTDISTLPVLGIWAFGYAGGSGSTSRWVAVSSGGYIYYSDDFGATWDDKRGNVLQLDTIAHFNIVKVLEF